MIKIILAYNQKLVRQGIKLNLNLHNDMEVIAEAENGMQLIQILEEKTPDIILMDIKIPIIDGCEATKLIKQTYPNIKIIILTALKEENYIFNAIQSGADGYLLRSLDFDFIVKSLRSAYKGAMPLDPEIAAVVVKAFISLVNTKPAKNANSKLYLLSKRELDVVRLIAQGKNNKNISKILFITEGTVKNYVTKILSKLELNSRTELAIYYNNSNKDSCALKNA